MHTSERLPAHTPRVARWLAMLATAVLAVTGLTFLPGAAPATAVPGLIAGTVFTDFRSDGSLNLASTEFTRDMGLGGVTATAYRGDSVLVGQTTTSDSGSWQISTAGIPDGTPLRVQFDAGDAFPSFKGPSNGTSVQFVEAGQSNIRFAVTDPEDFTWAGPKTPLVSIIQYAGDNVGRTSDPSVVATPWDAQYTNETPQTGFPGRTTLASFAQTGSVWGSAYDRGSNTLFVSAVYKRQSGLGPLGLGGIYTISDLLQTDGQLSSQRGAFKAFLNVENLAIAGTGNKVDVGDVASNTARGLGPAGAPAKDVDAFENAARVGIGAIATSADGKYLYFVNLKDRNLYRVDLASKSTATRIPLNLPAGTVPWALAERDGRLYVGVVETGTAFARITSQKAYVLSAPASRPTTWERVLEFPLNYKKGGIATFLSGADSHDRTRYFYGWTDKWASGTNSVVTRVNGANVHIYPQAVFTSIGFDPAGYMLIGLADRTQLQGGIWNYSADPNDNSNDTLYTGYPGGDALIAARKSDTSWVIESNGTVGTRTAKHLSAEQGIGGAEFLQDRATLGSGLSTVHNETSFGSLVTMPGTGQAALTSYTPLVVQSHGTSFLSLLNGEKTAGYTHSVFVPFGESPGTFQKGGGLGQLSLIALVAPVQIGNRVWFDADQDGIQDPDEPSVPGVTVQLKDNDTGEIIGSKVTDAIGEYYFSSNETALQGKFVPDGRYTLTFVLPTTGNLFTGDARFGTVPWSEVKFTQWNRGSDRTIDSNANPTTGQAQVVVGAPGENDHGFDAGLIANALFEIAKEIDPAGGAAPADAKYAISATAQDFRGTAISLPGGGKYTIGAATSTLPASVPVGSRITVTEDISADPTITKFVVKPAGAVRVPQTVATTTTVVTVTNTLVTPNTSFTITKAVEGTADPAKKYTVRVWLDGKAASDVVIGAGEKSAPIEVPIGTKVRLEEVKPVGGITNAVWGDPEFTVGTKTGVGSIEFTVTSPQSVAVTLTNTVIPNGSFTLLKTVTGGDLDLTPAGDVQLEMVSPREGNQVFTYPDITLTPGKLVKLATTFPPGTIIKLREKDNRPALPGIGTWKPPVYKLNGTPVNPDQNGWITFEVTAGGTLAVEIINEADIPAGTFTLNKAFAGIDATKLSADAEFLFDVSIDGGVATRQVLNKANDFAYTPSVRYPVGTKLVITEVAPDEAALPADYNWFGGPSFKVDGQSAGNKAEFTIGIDGKSVAVIATNTAQPLGSFVIQKAVTGPLVTPDLPFSIKWWLNGEAQSPDLVVRNGATTDAVVVPVGSTVRLQENTPEGGIDSTSKWGTPRFTVGSQSADNGIVFTVGDQTRVTVSLKNDVIEQGSFEVVKSVTGDDREFVPAGGTYPVEIQVAGTTHTPSLVPGEAVKFGLYPVGTEVKVRELVSSLPTLPGNGTWSKPVFKLGDVTLTADDSGWVTFKVGSGETPLRLELTNTPDVPAATFSIEKKFDGVDSNALPEDAAFLFDVTAGGTSSTVTLNAANGWKYTSPTRYPRGTTVTVAEQKPADTTLPQQYRWLKNPTFSVNGVGAASSATFTIDGSTANVAVTATNYAQALTSFDITKAVDGRLTKADKSFTVEWWLDGTKQPNITVKAGATSEPVVVPVGSKIKLEEITPTGDIPADSLWATPVFTIGTTTASGSIEFIVTDQTRVSVGLTNTVIDQGRLSILKEVSGDTGFVPTATYPVELVVGTGAQKLALTPGTSQRFGPFPVGTTIKVREMTGAADLPSLPGTGSEWAKPVYTLGNQTLAPDGDGWVTFRVPDADVALQLTISNIADVKSGTFELTKKFSGIQASEVTASFTFDVTIGGATEQVTLNSQNNWTYTPGKQYPVGTQVTVTEVTPDQSQLPPGYKWVGKPAFTVNGGAAAETATFAITTDGSVVAVVATNTAQAYGGFSLTKSLDGPASAAAPRFTYDFKYTLNDDPKEYVLEDVVPGTPVKVLDLPKGTRVHLTEVARSDIGLSWAAPQWTVDGTPVSGAPTITIGEAGTEVAVTAKNVVAFAPVKFSIAKEVAGVPAGFDLDTKFTVRVAINDGPAVEHEISASTPWISNEYPVDTLVTISEVTPDPTTLPESYDWTGVTLVGPGGEAMGEDGTLSFKVTDGLAGDAKVVTVTNTASQKTGSFQLTKQVTGGEAAADLNYVFDWSVDGVAQAAPISILAGAEGTFRSGQYPRGTKITLREQAPTGGLSNNDIWSGDVVFTGSTFTRNAETGEITFTIAEDTTDVASMSFTATNTIIPRGTFAVAKTVTGPAQGGFDARHLFAFEYRIGANGTVQTATVGVSESWRPSEPIEEGTKISIREAELEDAEGLSWSGSYWGEPTYAVNGDEVEADAEGWISFDLGDSASILITNEALLHTGTFDVKKLVDGRATVGDLSYLVRWSADHPSFTEPKPTGVLRLSKDQTAGPVDAEDRPLRFPEGTEITLTEAMPQNLPDGVIWVGSEGVFKVGDEFTNTLVIQSDGEGEVGVHATVTNTFERPAVDIEKGDAGAGGTGETIVNDADTMGEGGQFYEPGETRKIVFTNTNTGTEPLLDVVVREQPLQGGEVTAMSCVFPDGTESSAVDVESVLTVVWERSARELGDQAQSWDPDVTFTCTAQLTINDVDAEAVHTDRASIDATGRYSGHPVFDRDDYNAYTATIQIIKYDGNKPDPAVKDELGQHITPKKHMDDLWQDANDSDHALLYEVNKPEPVRWVVTNTSKKVWLTDIDLWDVTHLGPAIDNEWVCDLTPLEQDNESHGPGPEAWRFTNDEGVEGPTTAKLLWAPGVSFFCDASLTLPAPSYHSDTIHVEATVVVPADYFDSSDAEPTVLADFQLRSPVRTADAAPAAEPMRDERGLAVRSLKADGSPWRLADDDPFNAYTKAPPLAMTGVTGTMVIATSAFLLMGSGGLFLYWMLIRRLRREDAP